MVAGRVGHLRSIRYLFNARC